MTTQTDDQPVMNFSPEGLEELRIRIARAARTNEEIRDRCEKNNLPYTPDIIEQAILGCQIRYLPEGGGDIQIKASPRLRPYVIWCGDLIFALIGEELGVRMRMLMT